MKNDCPRFYIKDLQKELLDEKASSFESYEDTGNQSVKHFSVKITIDGQKIAKGRSTSKKKAEEMAAKRVYFAFQKQIANT